MEDPFRMNRDWWNEAVPVHLRSEGPDGYDVDGFRKGRSSLQAVERAEVGDVVGKRLLHLQCHFGLDTLSWARLGADVTGVDFSEKGIEAAQSLAAELRIPARFVLSNVYDLPRVLDETFDVVFSSYGAINWLPDLGEWARIAARFLRPGGFLYLLDAHPFSRIFDDAPSATDLAVAEAYWRPGPIRITEDGTYADPAAHFEHRTTLEFAHTLGTIVDAVIQADLQLEFLHEFPFCGWKILPFMEKGEDGYYRLQGTSKEIPLLFSIRARKPTD